MVYVAQASLLALRPKVAKKFQTVPVHNNHKLEACATLEAYATVAQASLLACGVSIPACGNRDTNHKTRNHKLGACATLEACATKHPRLITILSIWH